MLIILTSIATLVALVKGFYAVYLREGQDYLQEIEMTKVSYPERAEYVMTVLIGICLGIGFYPQSVLQYVTDFVRSLGVI